MFLRVLNQKTGAHIYDGESRFVTWTYNLEVGPYTFSFSGDDSEKKAFSAFQNVGNYRKALITLADFLKTEIEKIHSNLNKQAAIVNHNFVETCKHVRDPIQEILPKLRGARNHGEKIQRVVAHLKKSKPEDIAVALLDVDRAITNLQTQISGLEIISGEYTMEPIGHDLRALTDNLLAPFDRNFDKISVRVINQIPDTTTNQQLVSLDYNLMNWAFYHLLNNAVKYCRQGTDLRVRTDSNQRKIVLEMTSLRVENDEIEKIFTPGMRGHNAQMNFSGEGLGMYFARFSLRKMGSDVLFIPHNETCVFFDGKPYCANEIEIRLPA